VLFGMGLVGGPIIFWLLIRRFRRSGFTPESVFWIAFIGFCAFVGLAIVGERDELGVAHLTLFALEVLGLTLLASALTRRRALMFLIIAGCILDFSFGVLLNAHIQSIEENSARPVFGGLEFSDTLERASPATDALSNFAWMNWFGKHRVALCDEWLAQMPEHNKSNPKFESNWPGLQTKILKMRQEDDIGWGGWYSRHNGEIEYIGDHVVGRVGEALPAAVLLILAVGLIATLIRQTPAAALRPARNQHHHDFEISMCGFTSFRFSNYPHIRSACEKCGLARVAFQTEFAVSQRTRAKARDYVLHDELRLNL
jgi:hypothetical protein